MQRWVVTVCSAIGTLAGIGATPAAGQERVLWAEVYLNAPPAVVWDLWTTESGLRSFFAPAARIDPRVDGVFEILFSPEKPPGERGAEGLRIVAFEPQTRFAFTWNAPPHVPAIRAQRTVVEIRLAPSRSGTTLTFLHWGWGVGPDWDTAYDYFDHAWNGVVLPRLEHRIDHGPLTGTPPTLEPIARTLKHGLKITP